VNIPRRRSITPRESETIPPVLQWLALQGIRVHRRNVGLIRQEYKGKSRWVRFAEPGMCDYFLGKRLDNRGIRGIVITAR
jgi:hypothetical protein